MNGYQITTKDGVVLYLSLESKHDRYYLSTQTIQGAVSPERIGLMPALEEGELERTIRASGQVLAVIAQSSAAALQRPSALQPAATRPPVISARDLTGTSDALFRAGLAMGVDYQHRRAGDERFLKLGEILDVVTLDRPKTTYDQIGGQHEARTQLTEVGAAFIDPVTFQSWGVKPAHGVVLYGPRGNGQPMLVRALATQVDARLVHVNAADLTSKDTWVAVQNVLELASQGTKKTIIHIENLPALFSDGVGGAAGQKALAELLKWFDSPSSHPNALIVTTVGDNDKVPPILLDSGRFDRQIAITPPDRKDRTDILRLVSEQVQQTQERVLFGEVDWEAIARDTPNYSGEDLADLVQRTLRAKALDGIRGNRPAPVTASDIQQQIQSQTKLRKQLTSTESTFHGFRPNHQ